MQTSKTDMMKKNIWIIPLLLFALVSTGCQKKRISYTDMIKRENKEIKEFMDKQGFVQLKSFPNRELASNEFVEITDGVWLNIIDKGGEKAVHAVTPMSVRFSFTSIGDRLEDRMVYSNYGSKSAGESPLTFVYRNDLDSDYNIKIDPAPNSTAGEIKMSQFACNALMLPLEHVGIGGKVRLITSFREGPGFTSKEGIALYYEMIEYQKKK